MAQEIIQKSLGVVTPGGTPTRLTANATDPTAEVWCHHYRVYPFSAAGRGYLGTADLLSATGDNCFAIITNPSEGFDDHYEAPTTNAGTSNPYNLAGIYLDADNGNDSFLVTYTTV